MKLSEFKSTIKAIDECDNYISLSEELLTSNSKWSKELRDTLLSSVKQRRSNLLLKIKSQGVNIED